MPVSWRIERAAGLVVLTSDREASFDEWSGALNAAAGAPGWRAGLRVLHDCRALERVPSSAEAQSRGLFVARRAKSLGIERWAAVVPEDISKRETYWLAAIYADRGSVWCRTFTNIEEAKAWLQAPTNGKVLM